jgi:hypothetical protein
MLAMHAAGAVCDEVAGPRVRPAGRRGAAQHRRDVGQRMGARVGLGPRKTEEQRQELLT